MTEQEPRWIDRVTAEWNAYLKASKKAREAWDTYQEHGGELLLEQYLNADHLASMALSVYQDTAAVVTQMQKDAKL